MIRPLLLLQLGLISDSNYKLQLTRSFKYLDMKKYKLLLMCIGVTAIALNSCDEDTVDLDPIGSIEPGFFQTEGQMTEAILGTYQKLTFFYQFAAGNFLQRVDLLPSDDITSNSNYPHEKFHTLNGNDRHNNDIYRYAYQLIARANTVLQKIEENGSFAYAADSDADDWHRGEALFLRSLMYFKLWNVYGTAPLVTERIVELDDAFPPNTTGTQLLDQAIIDLTEAMTLLPESWDAGNLGRATQNSAKGLLIKSLVFRGTVSGSTGDFTMALTVFNGIAGAELAPNYDDNFDATKENNIESMFEFQAIANINNNANTWVAGGNDAFAVIGELNAFYGFFTGDPFGVPKVLYATPALLSTYDVSDPRLSLAFDNTDPEKNIIKYLTNNQTFTNANLSENNPRILRYADVMLLAAEATVRSGGSISDAIGIVNQIRERARNSSEVPSAEPAEIMAMPATPAEALDIIFKERRMELAAEEAHRWQDLRRRHIAGEINLGTWNFDSASPDFDFQPHNINFPLPTGQVIENPNLNQNDGYIN